ncbi:hypothetical protein Tco_0907374 [Tanacetum coccineum]|uniref:Uncharacterized protein n=1 Tax=Tanacetum coccineum TaxID=301880 RepID=A0ABQ5CQJ8_9ASTR
MALDENDQDAKYTLSKLLQMGMVEDYQREFEMLIKRVTISEYLLKSFYISGLKLDLQCLLFRSNPKTLDKAFSLARVAETRFTNLDIWEFLRSNPSTLGEDFFKARITEARFEIIAKKEKEHFVEKKIDVILPIQGEFASPKAKGSLNADEYISVEEVVAGGEALGIGKDNDLGDAITDEGDDAVESGEISILNSLIGHGSPRETLLCENMCAHVATEIQGLRKKVDLNMLLMKGILRRQQQQQIATNAKIQRRL